MILLRNSGTLRCISSFCIRHFIIPTYVNMNTHLIRGDITATFTSLFARYPRVYLFTRLVSDVTTPVVWICIQSWITGRDSLGGNFLTGWSISTPWYKREGKLCAPNITTSESGINPIVVVPSTPFSINPLTPFLHPPLRLLKCQPQPPSKLHGNWLHYASSVR